MNEVSIMTSNISVISVWPILAAQSAPTIQDAGGSQVHVPMPAGQSTAEGSPRSAAQEVHLLSTLHETASVQLPLLMASFFVEMSCLCETFFIYGIWRSITVNYILHPLKRQPVYDFPMVFKSTYKNVKITTSYLAKNETGWSWDIWHKYHTHLKFL